MRIHFWVITCTVKPTNVCVSVLNRFHCCIIKMCSLSLSPSPRHLCSDCFSALSPPALCTFWPWTRRWQSQWLNPLTNFLTQTRMNPRNYLLLPFTSMGHTPSLPFLPLPPHFDVGALFIPTKVLFWAGCVDVWGIVGSPHARRWRIDQVSSELIKWKRIQK